MSELSADEKKRLENHRKKVFEFADLIFLFIKKWGFIETMAVIAVIMLFTFPNEEQKEELVDRYLLFRGWQTFSAQLSYIYIIILLLISNIVTIVGWNYTSRMRKAENKRLGKEKSELQALLTKKVLGTSEED